MLFWAEISSCFACKSGVLGSPAALEIFHPEFLFLVGLSTWMSYV